MKDEGVWGKLTLGGKKRRRRIKVPTYLSCEHKQSDEEDEERDGAHGLQVFQNSRPQRSESDGDMWGKEAGEGMEKDRSR